MTAIEKLSGPKLHALIAKRDAACSAALDATIAAGMGMMKHSDIVALSTGSELVEKVRLAREYLMTRAEWANAHDELDARRRYQGSDKPIKRAVWS
mgnify:CR=1 FL=1